MDCEHYQTVDSPKREPRVGRALFGVHVSTNSSHQILIFQMREIFLNLTYSVRKNISFPKCPKTQNCHKLGDLELLETWPRFRQERPVKTAFISRAQFSVAFYPLMKRQQPRNVWNLQHLFAQQWIFINFPYRKNFTQHSFLLVLSSYVPPP